MGAFLPTFPAVPQLTYTVTLEEEQFRLRFTWRRRLRSWYVDLFTLGGVALAVGRRLSAGWDPFFGLVIEGGPDGLFLVRGSDGYARLDLGVTLRLVYYTRAELVAAKPAADADDVVIEIA